MSPEKQSDKKNAGGKEAGIPSVRDDSRARSDVLSLDFPLHLMGWIKAAAIVLTVFLSFQLLVIVKEALSDVITVILYIVFGFVIMFLARPIVRMLERRARWPRTLATTVVLICFLLTIGLIIYLIYVPLVVEFRALANDLPSIVDKIRSGFTFFEKQLTMHGITVGGNNFWGISVGSVVTNIASVFPSVVSATFSTILAILIVLVVAFWLLKDGEALRENLTSILPAKVQSEVDFVLDASNAVLGGYVRVQLLMAVFVGAFAGIGCALIGVPFPLVIALTAGIFELIPMVGPFIGGLIALLLALTVSGLLFFETLILFIIIHIIDAYFVSPLIQGRFVKLHPLFAFLAIFAGAEIGGFLGALFAVPTASLIAVLIRVAMGDWRAQNPDLFTQSGDDYSTLRRRRKLLGDFHIFRRHGSE